MPQSNQVKGYTIQNDTIFDDGREEELVEFVLNHPDKTNIEGSPARVSQAIEEFSRTKKHLMNVGEPKEKIVKDFIQEWKPHTVIEHRGYCGYSTILYSSAVRDSGGEIYYSVEQSPKFAMVIESLVRFAGLSDIVQVLVGPNVEVIQELHSKGLKSVDMIFLDHDQAASTTDLKLYEQLGLIKEGTILVADNFVAPGNSLYLEYVRSTISQKRLKYFRDIRADTERFGLGYAARHGDVNDLSMDFRGNPNLIYESRLYHSFQPKGRPDGVEITRCIGEAQAYSET